MTRDQDYRICDLKQWTQCYIKKSFRKHTANNFFSNYIWLIPFDLTRFIIYNFTAIVNICVEPMWICTIFNIYFIPYCQSKTTQCGTGDAGRIRLWRHNGRDSVSNHQPNDCLLNHLFRRRSKKISKLRVTGLCVGNSRVTGEFLAQMASNAENVSIWWRHHEVSLAWSKRGFQWSVDYPNTRVCSPSTLSLSSSCLQLGIYTNPSTCAIYELYPELQNCAVQNLNARNSDCYELI